MWINNINQRKDETKMRYILLGIGLIIFNASAFCQTTKWREIYTVKKKIRFSVSPLSMD